MTDRQLRPRRSNLAVPGSSQKMIDKARGLPADQVFLDLEDAVRAAGQAGRPQDHRGLAQRGRLGRQDPGGPGQRLDDALDLPRRGRGGRGRRRRTSTRSCCPRCRPPSRSSRSTPCSPRSRRPWASRSARIGIEAQIENARGLINVDAIAQASPRVETIIFGPADFMASINMKSLVVGEQPPGLRRRRRLPLHPDADPDGRPGQRQAGHRRPVPADPRRRRLPPGVRPQRRARLRRQVGAAPRSDRRVQRGLRPAPGGLRPRRADPRRVRVATPRRPAAPAARSCWATR